MALSTAANFGVVLGKALDLHTSVHHDASALLPSALQQSGLTLKNASEAEERKGMLKVLGKALDLHTDQSAIWRSVAVRRNAASLT